MPPTPTQICAKQSIVGIYYERPTAERLESAIIRLWVNTNLIETQLKAHKCHASHVWRVLCLSHRLNR